MLRVTQPAGSRAKTRPKLRDLRAPLLPFPTKAAAKRFVKLLVRRCPGIRRTWDWHRHPGLLMG